MRKIFNEKIWKCSYLIKDIKQEINQYTYIEHKDFEFFSDMIKDLMRDYYINRFLGYMYNQETITIFFIDF